MQPDNVSIPNPFDFRGKIILITGGGRGLGKGIARQFARAGARLALHYQSSAAAAEQFADEIRSEGGEAWVCQADLTNEEQTTRLFADLKKQYGKLDGLINNAGIYPLRPLLEMSLLEWEETLQANLRSVFLCTRLAVDLMKISGGAIVNIATIEALSPAAGHSHYSSAKAGVLMFTRASALELGPLHIRVNAVSPGLIWRDGIEASWPQGVNSWKALAPLERLGLPEDIANACLFLSSPAAEWISGTNLVVDGGMSARPFFG